MMGTQERDNNPVHNKETNAIEYAKADSSALSITDRV